MGPKTHYYDSSEITINAYNALMKLYNMMYLSYHDIGVDSITRMAVMDKILTSQ